MCLCYFFFWVFGLCYFLWGFMGIWGVRYSVVYSVKRTRFSGNMALYSLRKYSSSLVT